LAYTKEIIVNVTRDRAFEMFEDSDHYAEWQDGFQSMELVSGAFGTPGSTYKIMFDMNGRVMELDETLIERRVPEYIHLEFQAGKTVWNGMEYTFTDLGDGRTKIHIDCVFKCKGFVAVMAFFMPFMFKNQTQKYLDGFKAYAEAADV